MKALLLVMCLSSAALAGSYPKMAKIEQYRMTKADEVALAKSAAPASLADHAEILVLGAKGYETAVKGTNGFVCFVGRSWAVRFADPQFWNPKIRAPECMNAVSVRSVLPHYLTRTEWVLAGVAPAEMQKREAATKRPPPEPEALCYMLSKGAYLSDTDVHWHPHIMFFAAHGDVGLWGANLPGSPVVGDDESNDNSDTYFIVVANWSDGTPGPAM